ncbi:hypothetical protein M8J76_009988 [Diaphorina citri]|nr:hypothetical protein M8J76_009988 [Diaphorina citri]
MFSTDTQSYHSLLYLFDLDQWFSAQMPEEYNVARSGPRHTALHDLTQVLDARALPISIEVYRNFEKIITSKNRHILFESYYYPNAYSFPNNQIPSKPNFIMKRFFLRNHYNVLNLFKMFFPWVLVMTLTMALIKNNLLIAPKQHQENLVIPGKEYPIDFQLKSKKLHVKVASGK